MEERQYLVRQQLMEMSGYGPDQPIDERVLKDLLDQKKNGEFDQNLFQMIITQTKKMYDGSLTIEQFSEVYCQAENNLVGRSKNIEEEIQNHRIKQEEFTA